MSSPINLSDSIVVILLLAFFFGGTEQMRNYFDNFESGTLAMEKIRYSEYLGEKNQ